MIRPHIGEASASDGHDDRACLPGRGSFFLRFLRSFNTTMVTVFTFDRYYIAVNRKTIAGPKAWLVGSVKMKK